VRTFLKILVLSLAVVFAGCGGGSSDDGAGSSGSVVFSASGPFIANGVVATISTTITVSGGTITITDGVDTGSAPLSADGMNFAVPIPITADPTFSCNRPFVATGTISGLLLRVDILVI